MAGPMQPFLYIHDAILREVAHLEDTAKELDRDSESQVGSFSERLRFFQRVLKAHEDAEEEFLFPALENRFRHIADTYVFDHDHTGIAPVAEALASLGRTQGGRARAEEARSVHSQAVALHETMRLHVTKENELLLSVMEDVFSDDEQAGIMRQMLGYPPPELTSQILLWIFRGQSVTDREGFLRMGMQMFPQERFDSLVQSLSSAISPEEWQDVIQRIPQIAERHGDP